MMAFALAGARRVVGLDVRNWMSDNADLSQTFSDISTILKKEDGELFLKGFCVDDDVIENSLTGLSSSTPIEYNIYPGDRVRENDNVVQLLYSKSVLEHVKRNKVKKALKEYYRILKQGGYALHIIDLRDHLHIKGDNVVEGDWLEALRYPEWLFDAMTSNRRAYINRIRSNTWKKMFVDAGFEIIMYNERHEILPQDFSKDNLSLPFRSLDEDFSVSWIEVLLRK